MKYYLSIGYYEAFISTSRKLNFMRGYNPFGEFDSLEEVLDYVREEFPSADLYLEKGIDDDCYFLEDYIGKFIITDMGEAEIIDEKFGIAD